MAENALDIAMKKAAPQVPYLNVSTGQLTQRPSGNLDTTLSNSLGQATTPLTAARGGATPAAASMAATPAALGTAQAQKSPNTPGPAAPTKQLSISNANDIAAREKLKKEMGDTNFKAADMIAKAVTQITAAPGASTAVVYKSKVDDNGLRTLGTSDPAKVRAAMDKYAADPSEANLLALQRAARDGGGALAATALDSTKLVSDLFEKRTAAEDAADKVADTYTLTAGPSGPGKISLADVGIDATDQQTLAPYLPKGKTWEQITVAELDKMIDALTEAETSSSEVGASQRAAVGQTGAAEAGAAQTDVSPAAVAAAQDELAAIAGAATETPLTVGDKSLTISEWMKDANIIYLSDAVNSEPPNAAVIKQLEDAGLGNMVQWFRKNKEMVQTISTNAGIAASGLKGKQEKRRKQLKDLTARTGISGGELFGINFDNLETSDALDRNNPRQAILAAIMDSPDDAFDLQNSGYLRAQLQWLNDAGDAALAAFAGVTPAQLRATGVLGKSPEDKARWDKFKGQIDTYKRLLSAGPKGVAKYLFGSESYATLFGKARANPELMGKVQGFLDADKDGRLDDGQAIDARLQHFVTQNNQDTIKKFVQSGQLLADAGAEVVSGKASTKLSGLTADNELSDADIEDINNTDPENFGTDIADMSEAIAMVRQTPNSRGGKGDQNVVNRIQTMTFLNVLGKHVNDGDVPSWAFKPLWDLITHVGPGIPTSVSKMSKSELEFMQGAIGPHLENILRSLGPAMSEEQADKLWGSVRKLQTLQKDVEVNNQTVGINGNVIDFLPAGTQEAINTPPPSPEQKPNQSTGGTTEQILDQWGQAAKALGVTPEQLGETVAEIKTATEVTGLSTEEIVGLAKSLGGGPEGVRAAIQDTINNKRGKFAEVVGDVKGEVKKKKDKFGRWVDSI